jgi:hypothetical protein
MGVGAFVYPEDPANVDVLPTDIQAPAASSTPGPRRW